MARLHELLLERRHAALYAVADAAVLQGLLEPLYALGHRHFACLLPGALEPDVAHVAPYLIALAPDSPAIAWLEARLTLPWGYVVETTLPLRPLQLHLRRFSETRGPQGEDLLFRFWDPRILRVMPSILTPAQGEAFMQGITCLHLLRQEAAQPAILVWDKGECRLRFSDDPVETGVIDHVGV